MKNIRFFIIVPFLKSFERSSGTTIRIAGYTSSLEELGVDYRFLSTIKPEYVPSEKYELLKMGRKWIKLILIHNLFFSSFFLRPFSYLIRLILDNIAGLKKISRIVGNKIVWSHQENTIALYLYFVHGKTFIYDVHGFFDIQREYRHNLNKWGKFWFDIYLINEKLLLNNAPFINVVSALMKKYVENTFKPKGKILLAPDGIPAPLSEYFKTQTYKEDFRRKYNIQENDEIILFAGSFKKMGGVTDLVKVFIENENLHTRAVLFIIGNGQEEPIVDKLLYSSNCKERVFHLNSMPHNELIKFMKAADVLVCPDIAGNLYNKMTPHIKLYDAIASGKNVVATNFHVNRELFNSGEYNIFYFSYDLESSFRDTLLLALKSQNKKYNQQELEKLTYMANVEKYLKYFN